MPPPLTAEHSAGGEAFALPRDTGARTLQSQEGQSHHDPRAFASSKVCVSLH